MAVVLGVALFLARGVRSTDPGVSKDEAVAIARAEVDFTPEGHNIRFMRRGIPPRPFWAVSFWIRAPEGGYSKVTVAIVDANTGRVTEVRRTT
jgi:hypothetical protein